MIAGRFYGLAEATARPKEYARACDAVLRAARAFVATHTASTRVMVVGTGEWGAGLAQDLLEALIVTSGATDVVEIVPRQKLASLGSLLRESARQDSRRVWTLHPVHEGGHLLRESRVKREGKLAAWFLDPPARVFVVGLDRLTLTVVGCDEPAVVSSDVGVAALLKNALCPELWMITSGVFGACASSHASVGPCRPSCSSGSQPLR